jgi:hypothetical protein
VERFCSIVCRKTGINYSVFYRAVDTEKIRFVSLVKLSPKTTVSRAILLPANCTLGCTNLIVFRFIENIEHPLLRPINYYHFDINM